MKKIFKYVLIDILRNRILIIYTLILLAISFTIFNLEDNSAKAILSLLNIVLIIVPLVSILFASIYVYNSAEFLELLLSQPLQRKTIWFSLFAGLAFSLFLAFLIGIGIPMCLYHFDATGCMMIATGLLLTIIFVSLAMFATVRIRDKAKGIGMAILLWLYFSVLYDGFVLMILFQFQDYPLEKVISFISALNPIDLGRILLIIQMDVSALMGYTGAVFKNIFGSAAGTLMAFMILSLWSAIPVWLSLSYFKSKDL